MRKSFLKNVFRTIGNSFGRYMALICIVTLGVVFYAGLKISTVDMIDTANDYYNTYNFYDFSLVSTVGFSSNDVFELRKESQAFNVCGAYYQDMIVSDDVDSNYVVRIHSITDEINILELKEGRLPETADECVIDGRYYDESYIGQKIRISSDNSEESLDNMVYKELTVTGIVNSPLYLSYQRGTTSVGNGSIHSYIFVDFACFSIDYYSQIFVDFQDGYYIYEDDYNRIIDERHDYMENLAYDLAEIRYNELSDEISDAQTAYTDALEVYNNACAQYEEALEQYNYSYDVNEADKNQLAAINEQYEILLEYKEENIQYGNDSAVKGIESQLYTLNEAKTSLELLTEMTDSVLLETKSALDETKQQLDESLSELQENEYIMSEDLGELKVYALDREANEGYATYKDNADIVASIAYIFPVFFVLVASLVCITTMSRMVEEERTQIGVFKALGYSKRTIFGKYIFYSLSAAIIGSVLGFYIGSYLFPTVIWKAYSVMYTYSSDLNIIHDYSILALSILVSVAVLVGSTVFTCYRVMNEEPAEMIRPKAPAPGKRVFLERIKVIWDRVPFLHKVSIRNCFRYKKRFFMMLIGIAGCTALLVIGFGIQDSISSVCNDQYDRIEIYDFLISANDNLSEEENSTLISDINACTDSSISIALHTADISLNDKKKSISLVTCDELTELDGFINLSDENGKIRLSDDKECIISRNLSESINAEIGDEIIISFDNLQEESYTISGIYENYVKNFVFITKNGYVNGYGSQPYYNCILANTAEGIDVYEKITELSGIENVSGVSATQVSRDYFNEVIKSLDVIVYLVIVCAAVLAFVVLYNLNNINIMERVREIATIKVLGFFKNETSGYVFRENLILTLFGTLCGLPTGYFMHRVVMSKIKVDLICFNVHVDLSSYIFSAALTFLFSIIVELFMRRKIAAVNMSESLKSIE
ncbi:MAG: FtsX-like permease family protein [Lachnospiraceae bacterium]